MTVRAIVFDVGETLVDETRTWGVWADALGVPRLTFFAALGAVIARGGDHREVFELFRPGLDLAAARAALRATGASDAFSLDDLYPDALPALRELHAAGFRLGIAGNQPSTAADVLAELGVGLDLVATSEGWGVEKPDPAFFERIAAELALPPSAIAYVGDRLDNDVRPAAAAGLVAVFVRRGPWGWICAGRSDPPEAAVTIETLTELPEALTAGRATAG
jgi:FMN phosphatase YigB (HAD superfamily)